MDGGGMSEERVGELGTTEAPEVGQVVRSGWEGGGEMEGGEAWGGCPALCRWMLTPDCSSWAASSVVSILAQGGEGGGREGVICGSPVVVCVFVHGGSEEGRGGLGL